MHEFFHTFAYTFLSALCILGPISVAMAVFGFAIALCRRHIFLLILVIFIGAPCFIAFIAAVFDQARIYDEVHDLV